MVFQKQDRKLRKDDVARMNKKMRSNRSEPEAAEAAAAEAEAAAAVVVVTWNDESEEGW